MPAYTSISFSFDKPVNDKFVEQFYDVILNDEIKFKGVMAWGCSPDMTLADIIIWNQYKVDSNFIPEMDTDVSHYERQIYLDVEPFSECRLILSSDDEAVYFRCIVPECEITPENFQVLEKAALRIWGILPVKFVETSGELDFSTGYALAKLGVQPSVKPFAILDDDCSKMASQVYFLHKKLTRGFLLQRNPAHGEYIIVSETIRIARKIGSLATEEAFTDDHIANHGVNDAVERLVGIISEKNMKLEDKDFHQLSFMADELGIDFPEEN